MQCLFPKCVAQGVCQGHKVTSPKQPNWTTLCAPYVAVMRPNDYPLITTLSKAWFV